MKVNDSGDKQPIVGRRSLLRGGAVLAGAGLAGTALAQPAAAAGVDAAPVLLGVNNAETTTTGLTVNAATGDPDVPALSLTNADGPSLYLDPLEGTWNGTLEVGQVANTTYGPLIGVQDPSDDEADNPVTTFLATGVDLEALPVPTAITPFRLVDTRSKAGREGIVGSSPNCFTSDFKLKPFAYIDVLVAQTDAQFGLPSVFINLTAVAAERQGYVSAYPPGAFPGTSTLNVIKGQTVANSAFVAVREVGDFYAIRIYTTAECWIVVDLTGAVTQGFALGATGARQAARSRPSIVKQMLAKVGRRR